jgi:PAS domain S-box-containing protein
MADQDKVNILLVDDQPAKLLSLDVILQPLNENILRASSADEALRHLLQSDVAVVLVDVCMPGMDGFELAEMIREHPRFGRTAIIFISAVHLTDADRLRGYGLGAVDYIPVPIIPEVLRAKVAVFAELYRKTEQLNSINRDLEKRVAERTAELENSNRLLRESREQVRLELAATQRLQETSTRLIRQEDEDSLYEQILDAAVAVTRSDFASLQMYHAERGQGELQLLAHRGFAPESARAWAWVRPESESTCGVALRTKGRAVVEDVLECPAMAGTQDLEAYRSSGIRAVQSTPLISRSGRLLGMISTHWREPTTPGERELRLLDVLGRQAADLIERSQSERALRESESRLADQKLALELALSDAPTSDALRVLAQAGRRQFGDEARTNIFLVSRDGRHLRFGASAGFDESYAREFDRFPIELDKPSCAQVAASGEPRIVPDVSADPAWGAFLELARRHGIGACWSFPIKTGDGRVLGTYAVCFPEARRPGDGDTERAALLAQTAALIVEKHHQIEKRTAAEASLRDSEAKFRTLADNMAQLAWMAEPDGSVFWLNRRWYDFTGLSYEDSAGAGWTRTLHPDDSPRITAEIGECFRTGTAWEDTFLTRGADGTYRWFLTRAFPIKDEHGTVIRWFGTGTDVTEQREAQQVLTRDRETLERLVVERTRELERSNERLRLSERMATIGTLATGLGHDIGNLLLPVRLRLDSLDGADLPESAREDVAAVRKAAEYLQRLSGSLRLLALDSTSEDHGEARTDLAAWWRDSQGMMRNGLPQPVTLDSRIDPDLPPVRIGKAGLTQVVFNLVQNAGDALRGRGDGRVTVSVEGGIPGRTVLITVSDNGPGMSEDARRRCLEPFFTTKAREMSTGLGLPLVGAIVARAQGSLHVSSAPGQGASFRIELPVAAPAAHARAAPTPREAVVLVRDARLRAHVVATLGPLGMGVHTAPREGAEVWIADADDAAAMEGVRAAAAVHPDLRVILFAKDGARLAELPRAFVIDPRTRLSEVRGTLCECLTRLDEPALEGA